MGNIKASLFLAVTMLVVFTASAYVLTEVVPDDFDSEQGFLLPSDSPVPLGNQIEDIFDFEYTDTTAIVLKYKGQEEIVYVPNIVDGKPVTGIADGAFIKNLTVKEVHLPDSVTELGISVFEDCSSLERVTLPNGITKISEKTFFHCPSLKSLEIPDTVLTIDRVSFYGCSSLTHITIPYGVVEIGQDAFSYSGLVTVDLPETVSKIEKYAFYTCTDLKELTIPEGVTVIGAKTFWHCESMEYIHLPESLKTIEISAFVSCYSLKELHIPSNTTNISIYAFEYCNSLTEFTVGEGNSKYESIDGILYDKTSKMLFACPALKEGHVTIAYGTKSINGLAFYSCVNMTGVTIPDTVTKIGGSAFSCSSLTYIWIPSSVIDIVGSTFSSCHQLTEIEVSRDNPVYGSVDGILYKDNMETLFMAPPGKGGHITIPDGVKTIYGSAFYVNHVLTGVTFPDSLTAINSSAFWKCTALTDVIIPANVTEIGNYAFGDCGLLEYIIFLGNGMEQSYGPIPVDKTIYYLEGNTGFESWRNTHKIPVSSPDNVTVAYFYNNSSELKFSWNYPANHVRAITSYTLSYREAGTDDPFRYIDIFSNMGTSIAGLKSGTDYELRIISENFAGTSESILSTKTLRIYSVNFDANGGDGAPPSAIYADEGTTMSLPDAEDLHMTGHTFTGWSLSPSGSVLSNNVLVANNDAVLYAIWKTNQYIIYFETSGGTLIPSVQQYYGMPVDVPENPVREGHTFIDWNTIIPEIMPAENLNISAIWEVNLYRITWIVDDVKLDIDIEYGSRINIPRFDGKEGHTFIGWDMEIPEAMPANDLTIKANWSVNTYELIWIVDEVHSVNYYRYGYEIDKPENPVKEGYTFIDWDTEMPGYMPAYDFTITALWEINQYAVTFVFGNGEDNFTVIRDYGTNISVPENPTREGHTFSGWDRPIPSTVPSENLEIAAVWVTNAYCIVWIVDGSETEQEYLYGNPVFPVEDPVKEGHTFVGWDSDIPATMPATDIVLTAEWSVNIYSLTWVTDNEVFIDGYGFGTEVVRRNDPFKEGHTFMGWDSDIPETMPAEDVIVTATWSVNTYFMTWNVDGEKSVEEYDYGGEVIPIEDPVKEGYTFNGWSNEIPEIMPSEDISLQALWIVNVYGVSWNIGDTVFEVDAEYGSRITVPRIMQREGHEFLGWDTYIPETMPAYNLEINALWQVCEYVVTWIADDAQIEDMCGFGDRIIIPEDPVKEGYSFVGWDADVPGLMPSEDLKITALWEINQYTVTLIFDNGEDNVSITQDYGSAIPIPKTPVKEGHTFTGWDADIPETMHAKNLNVTALWTINQYAVTFVFCNGEDNVVINQNYGTEIPIIEDPAKEGHTFEGWDADIPETMPAEYLVIRAVWSLNTYTVYWNIDGTVFETNADFGSKISVPKIINKENHEFSGWNVEIPEFMPAANLTVTALWSADVYMITWIVDGIQTVEEYGFGSEIIHVEVPAKEGHVFAGWDIIVPRTMPAEDLTVTATWIPDVYSITWIDGDVCIIAEYKFGSEIISPYSPVREGYTFNGWDCEIPAIMPAENLETRAMWKVNAYSVFWIFNDCVVEEKYEYGSEILQRGNAAREGYTFEGWSRDIPITMPAENIVLSGIWSLNTYSVTWIVDGVPITEEYKYGREILKVAEPVREGHTFEGWNSDIPTTMPADNLEFVALWNINLYRITWIIDDVNFDVFVRYGSEIHIPDVADQNSSVFSGWDADIPETMPAEDLVITALWSANTYSLTWIIDDIVVIENYEFGSEIIRIDNPSKIGYVFTGWDTVVPETMLAENLEIRAVWELNTYSLTWVIDDTVIVEDYEYGSEIILVDAHLKIGHTFVGWNITIPETMPADNLMITALWSTDAYSLTWVINDTVIVEDYEYGSEIILVDAPSKTGQTFTGWDTVVPETMPAKNLTVTATWAPETYSIVWIDGDVRTVSEYEFGSCIVPVDNPSKIGYVFTGWDTVVPETMLAENLEIRAVWELNTYSLTWVIDDTVIVEDYEYGSEIIRIDDPSKIGHTFAGWNITIPETMPADNLMITALWSTDTYSLTWVINDTVITDDYQFGSRIVSINIPSKIGHTFTGWDTVVPATMPAEDLEIKATWKVNAYSVFWIFNNCVVEESYEYGSDLLQIENPVKEGHTFEGWNRDIPTIMPAENIVIFAIWSLNSYSVTWIVDGVPIMEEYEYGTEIEIIDNPAKTGYTFAGWDSAIPGLMPADDLVVAALWSVNTYSVTWIVDDNLSVKNYEYGSEIILVDAPSKTGHTFTGWDIVIPETMPAKNLTVTATWVSDRYSIIWVDEGVRTVTEYVFGSEIVLPHSPVREGYTFNGWDCEIPETMPAENLVMMATWSANVYSLTWIMGDTSFVDDYEYGSKIFRMVAPVMEGHVFIGWNQTVPVTMPADDMIITALWSANTYSLTWIIDDIVVIENYEFGSCIVPVDNPSKIGYVFTGWDTVVPETMPAKNLTVTAAWVPETYSIVWIDGDVRTVSEYEFGSEISSHSPVRDGYTFTGWDCEIPATMPAEDLEFRAVWEVNKYSLTWIIDGNVIVEDYEYGSEISSVDDPSKIGHAFTGWNCTVPETMPAENLTITATWSANVYSLTWIMGDYEVKEYYEYGAAISSVTYPVREGYSFAGWDSDVPITMPSDDLIVTATWSINTRSLFWIIGDHTIEEAYEYGAEVIEPEDIVREGYTFIGWNRTVPPLMPSENIVISAIWSPNTYSLFWDIDGVLVEDKYEFGSCIVLVDDPVKEGHTFTGWSRTLPISMPSDDITVKATWSVNVHSITWVVDGVKSVDEYEYGATVVPVENPVKNGYAFSGWGIDVPNLMPAEDLIFTAAWSVNTYSVTWIVDGVQSVDKYEYGENIVQIDSPVKTGCSFDCWSEDVPVAMPSENLVFVAMWNIEKYVLTFDLGNGNIKVSLDFGAEVIFDGIPERQGYEFAGWDTELPISMPAEDFTVSAFWNPKVYTVSWLVDGEIVESSEVPYGSFPAEPVYEPVKESDACKDYAFDRWSPEIVAVVSDTEYHAVFTETSRTYTVIYDTNGGIGNIPSPMFLKYGTVLQLSPVDGLYLDGHVMEGWSITSSGDAIDRLEVKGNITIYAVWNMISNSESEDGGISPVVPATAATSAVIFAIALALRRMRQTGKTE